MPPFTDTSARFGAFAWPWRVIRGRPRFFVGVICGVLAWFTMPHIAIGPTRAILAWDLGVLIYLGLSAFLFSTERQEHMAADAAAQEEGEWTVFWLTVAAIAFSFAANLEEFAGTKNMDPGIRDIHVCLVALTLGVSWLMTHTTFAFRYAHEYYQVEDASVGITGGLQFPDEQRPDYLDFMYFSMVIGMTFQVSDVQITSRKFRRLALLHGLLSFMFNTIIVALTVNLAAGLL